MHVVRKPCDQHRVDQSRGRRDSQRSTVQEGAAATFGREELAPGGSAIAATGDGRFRARATRRRSAGRA
jgi:hypothetical protein